MTKNNNGEWRATQAERWGWVRAKLEDQEKEIEKVQSTVKENGATIVTSVNKIEDAILAHLKDDSTYKKEMEGRITKIEVKAGIYGLVSGFIGGFTGTLIFFRKLFGG